MPGLGFSDPGPVLSPDESEDASPHPLASIAPSGIEGSLCLLQTNSDCGAAS